ncbi:MAG: sigma-54-dependent Fis family transcriptional regulator [Bacteroidales bacterium]|nr:sigma-54-dependent Fis family transcriptional regulator [Bacteroidales bacterium]
METQEEKQNILIIDDDPVYRRLSASILSERFTVFTADTPSVAFKILKKEKIKFVISDYLLPEMNGLQILEKIKKEFPKIEVIMISDSGNMDTVIEALRKGASDYFKKPFSPSDIWMSIERTLKYSKLKNELDIQIKQNVRLKQEINNEIGSIIGKSKQVKEIIDQIKMVAATPDTSVLIIGESGTGKELVARAIHDLSERQDQMFGAANMSAIPDTLFESEFFGHVKGSFTDAVSDKAGWFETVNKGTLFLDEVGEMTMNLQVKLLRVLEDRKYTKVGTQKSLPFDVRIVAATNKSIETLTDGSSFRLDLFHRLGTFIIHLPPLRERTEDIPLLVEHFLNSLNKKMGKDIKGVNDEVIKLLSNYRFAGNIRELRNLMERAIILCNGNELNVKHFDIIRSFDQHKPLNETFNLEEIEKNTIIRALEKTKFNKAEAARLLNIEWNALHRRLQKYDLYDNMGG